MRGKSKRSFSSHSSACAHQLRILQCMKHHYNFNRPCDSCLKRKTGLRNHMCRGNCWQSQSQIPKDTLAGADWSPASPFSSLTFKLYDARKENWLIHEIWLIARYHFPIYKKGKGFLHYIQGGFVYLLACWSHTCPSSFPARKIIAKTSMAKLESGRDQQWARQGWMSDWQQMPDFNRPCL